MRLLLLFFILFVSLTTLTWAASYSCRDSQGTLHFSDNPAQLPDSCRKNVRQVETKRAFGYNPSASSADTPSESAPSVNLSAAEIFKEEADQKRFEQLRQQVEAVVKKYTDGVALKEKSNRRWHYGSRAGQAQGDQMIYDAGQEKLQLLEKLKSADISEQQHTQLQDLLNLGQK